MKVNTAQPREAVVQAFHYQLEKERTERQVPVEPRKGWTQLEPKPAVIRCDGSCDCDCEKCANCLPEPEPWNRRWCWAVALAASGLALIACVWIVVKI